MTRALALRDWWQRLFLRAVTPSRDEPEDLSTPRTQAYAELRAAEARGDCRGIGTARMKLTQATTDELMERVWG